jgi:hypothetical protein
MLDFLSIFIGGENRITLPFFAYPPLLLVPNILLAVLVIIPPNNLSSLVKQCLSIPLLVAVFFIPFGFTNGNRSKHLIISYFY